MDTDTPEVRRDRLWSRACALFLALIFGYAILRAWIVSVTHDEALNILRGAFLPVHDIVSFDVGSVHHLLNTLLIRPVVAVFGLSLFTIRIPALLGCLLFLVSAFKISGLVSRGHRRLLGTLLFCCNPFLLEFFSLARGYSLGLGFLLWGVYLALLGLSRSHSRRRSIAIAAACFLACLSHLSFAYPCCALLTLHLIVEVLDLRAENSKRLLRLAMERSLPAVVTGLALVAVYGPPILEKKLGISSNEGQRGFFADVIGSVIKASGYDQPYFGEQLAWLCGGVVACIVIASAVLALRLLRSEIKREEADRYLLFSLGLLLVLGLELLVNRHLLGIGYINNRFALALIPLGSLLALSLWECLTRLSRSSLVRLHDPLFKLLVGLLLAHGLFSLNVTHTRLWRFDASTRLMLEIVQRDVEGRRSRDPVRMGVWWLYEPAINFYKVVDELNWLRVVDRNGADGQFDYYYLDQSHRQLVKKYDLEILREFPLSHSLLAAPRGR